MKFIANNCYTLYNNSIATIIHAPFTLFNKLPDNLKPLPKTIYNNIAPIIHNIVTYPQYFASTYPTTTSFFFATLFSLLILYDSETDLKHTPYFPIFDPTTPLGAAIATGRKVRRALGGRTFSKYQSDKLTLGEHTPTKQQFVNHYGAFVDELEWNIHYNYTDDHVSHVIYSDTATLSQEDLDNQIKFLRQKQRLALLDEKFRQEELLEARRAEVTDKIYNEIQWDLRDGSIIPPGQEPDTAYKPYIHAYNPDNPIPHEPGAASLGQTGEINTRPYFSKYLDENTKLNNYGEFTEELTDRYNSPYEPQVDPKSLRPHKSLKRQQNPWDPIPHAIARTAHPYGGGIAGEDLRSIGGVTAQQKAHMLGEKKKKNKFDPNRSYHKKLEKKLHEANSSMRKKQFNEPGGGDYSE